MSIPFDDFLKKLPVKEQFNIALRAEQLKCNCTAQYGFNCVCEWVKNNPGTIEYDCEWCGNYIASKPQCNKCEALHDQGM